MSTRLIFEGKLDADAVGRGLVWLAAAVTLLLTGCWTEAAECRADRHCADGERCESGGGIVFYGGVCVRGPVLKSDVSVDAADTDRRDTVAPDTDPRDTHPDSLSPDIRPVDTGADTRETSDSDVADTADVSTDTAPTGAPKAGAGPVIWRHDFSDGMPGAFKHDAPYPSSGTWGRQHQLDGGEVFEPASLEGSKLLLRDTTCSSRGTAYPTSVDRNLRNWELFYRVDARPGTDGHAERSTGGIGCVGCSPAGDRQGDLDQLSRGVAGFIGTSGGTSQGDAFKIEGWNGAGERVERQQPTGGIPIRDGEWFVRIATSAARATTWVKYWPAGQTEPVDWTHEFEDLVLRGRPGFFLKTSCKRRERANAYRFYALREIEFAR